MKSLWKGRIFMTEKCFEERFRDVEENYKVITNRIAEAAVRSGRKPEDITFLAATKTVPAEVINHAIGCGLRFIGENRVQEFMDKYEKIDWDKGVSGQIIGRLQTNKVKYIIDKVDCIQSVDSVKLAKEISRLAENDRKMPEVLIEVNIGGEESKAASKKLRCRVFGRNCRAAGHSGERIDGNSTNLCGKNPRYAIIFPKCINLLLTSRQK